MATKQFALIGASCEADGHPSSCQEPATGATQDADGDTSVTINGNPVATHSDSMHFGSHAHAYKDVDDDDSPECTDMSSHDLTPDQSPNVTINGQPIMRAGDTTTDPGSGGTAEIVDSGGQSSVTHTA